MENINELFEALCEKNNTTKSFSTIGATIDLFDLDRKGRDFAYPAGLLKDIDDGGFDGESGTLDRQIVTIFFVDRVTKEQTADDVKQAMKALMKIFLARLYKIRGDYSFLRHFNPKKANYFGVGPITGGIYGMGCTFPLEQEISMIDLPDEWQD